MKLQKTRYLKPRVISKKLKINLFSVNERVLDSYNLLSDPQNDLLAQMVPTCGTGCGGGGNSGGGGGGDISVPIHSRIRRGRA